MSFVAQVHAHVDVYNFTDNTWCDRIEMPKEMANSHLGMATDGRYIYAVTGQYGPQCRGPTPRCFVLDTKTKKWSDLPTLPVPRCVSYKNQDLEFPFIILYIMMSPSCLLANSMARFLVHVWDKTLRSPK